MLTTPIIGVTGRAESGKDTVCNMAIELLAKERITSRKMACADPLKTLCHQIFSRTYGVDYRHFYGTQADKNEPLSELPGWTGRKILQHIGTEGFRTIHPEVWSRAMIAEAREALKSNRVVFISDVRFLSEANIIKDAGGIIVRVLRPEADENTSNQGIQGHQSETELQSINHDYVVDNKGRSLNELRTIVEAMLCQLGFLPSTQKLQG